MVTKRNVVYPGLEPGIEKDMKLKTKDIKVETLVILVH